MLDVKPLSYIINRCSLFYSFEIQHSKIYGHTGFSLVGDWWTQWRSPEKTLPGPDLRKLTIRTNKSFSTKSLSNADRVLSDSAACDAVQEKRKRAFLRGFAFCNTDIS